MRRAKIFLIALIAPELIVLWAFRQWLASRKVALDFPEYGWTQTHGLFVIMGGFVYEDETDKGHRTVLTPRDIRNFVKPGASVFQVTEEELRDRSKGDVFAKSLVLIQATWFILQIAARAIQRLAITELEIATLAYAILNFVIYLCWWKKPLDVKVPISIRPDQTTLSTKMAYQTHNCACPSCRVTRYLRDDLSSIDDTAALGHLTFYDLPNISTPLWAPSLSSNHAAEWGSQRATSCPDLQMLHTCSESPVVSMPPAVFSRSSYFGPPYVQAAHPKVFTPQLKSRPLLSANLSQSCPSLGYTIKRSASWNDEDLSIRSYTVPTSPYHVKEPENFQFITVSHPPRPFLMRVLRDLGDLVLISDTHQSGWGSKYPFSPYYYGNLHPREKLLAYMLASGMASVFGGTHCVGWSFQFPTVVEQTLWQASSVLLTGIPIYGFVLLREKSLHLLSGKISRTLHLSRILIWGGIVLYFVARLILFIEMFVLLRAAPDVSVYQTVRWTTFIPHF
ncbi:hypothetical protein H0H87_000261 [Tephrocybe sp. NHM501043]|nr:hypothetical protein H0H87_000261 [Tephrocybe sp. NHM501043]